MIVVTGGAGFIGSNVVAELDGRGKKIAVVDRLDEAKWRNVAKREIAELVAPEGLFRFLEMHRGRDVSAVVHMGAVSSTTESDVDLVARTNFCLSLRLWRWCAEVGVPFVYASSAATYGDGSEGFDDDRSPEALAKLRPLNAYAWSKHAFDRRVARMVEEGERTPPQWVGLKFFNVYGPNEYHKGPMRSMVAKAWDAAQNGHALELFEGCEAERDFVYVLDCARVVCWLLDNPDVSGIFNVGTGEARTFHDVAWGTFEAAGHDPGIRYVPMRERVDASRYQYYTCAESGRLRDAGYCQPFRTLEEGIDEYVTDFLATGDPYR